MRKRSAVAFSGMLVALMAIIVRVLELSQGGLSKAAEQQSSLTITVVNVRGTIYDRNLRPLVNGRTSYRACVAGFPEAIAAVAPQLDEQAMAELEERLRTNRPAVVTLAEPAFPGIRAGVFSGAGTVYRQSAVPASAGISGWRRPSRSHGSGTGF